MIAPTDRMASPSLQYGIAAHFRHSRPARRHTSPSRGGPNAAVSVASGGPNAPPLPAIPAHSRAWRPPHQDRDEELPGQVTERAEHPRPEAVFFDPWTEPPERACVSLPRHECAVFGGERSLRE